MTKDVRDVWISKYALTQGIEHYEGVSCDPNDSMLVIRAKWSDCSLSFDMYYHKPEWHLTEEDARKQVAILLEKKLKSLRKQLKRYEGFEVKIKENGSVDG